jgi:hypothetical protein
MKKIVYSNKLKDPRWQKKRLEIMQRDEFTCCLCGDKESMLVVHHYKYDSEPWETDNRYLATLCSDCHEEEHANLKQYKELLSDELEGHDSSVYLSTASILHLLKEHYPLSAAANMLDYCLSDDTFFKEHIEKYFFEMSKRRREEREHE